MVQEQVSELMRKYHDLQLRDGTELFENNAGKLFVRGAGAEQVLEVISEDNKLQVKELTAEEFTTRSREAGDIRPLGASPQRGD